MATAASTIARSETPVTTKSYPFGFSASVTFDGVHLVYAFHGDHHDGTAIAVGRARRIGMGRWAATLHDGTRLGEHSTERDAMLALLSA